MAVAWLTVSVLDPSVTVPAPDSAPIVSEYDSARVPPVTVTAPVSASVVPLVLASVSVPPPRPWCRR